MVIQVHNRPVVQGLSSAEVSLVKTTGQGFLQVPMDILHWCFQRALDLPLNRITASVSLLNAESLSQQQIFRVWGSREPGGVVL